MIEKISAITFEPLFVCGIIGAIAVTFRLNSNKKYITMIAIALGIIMIRLLVIKKVESKRYLEDLIIPLILLTTSLLTININRRIKPFLYCILFFIVLLEFDKICKIDKYKLNIIQNYKKVFYNKRIQYDNNYIVSNIQSNEKGRLIFYSQKNNKNTMFIEISNELEIFKEIPDVLYHNIIVFVIESKNDSAFNIDSLKSYGEIILTKRLFESRKKDSAVLFYHFKPFLGMTNNNPNNTIGKNIKVLSYKEINIKNGTTAGLSPLIISGDRFSVQYKGLINVGEYNRIDFKIKIKNIGKHPGKVMIGYQLFDKNKEPIGGEAYPYNKSSQTLKVLSANSGDNFIVLDDIIKWGGANCHIALNAKDSFEDIPNNNLLKNKIKDIRNNITSTIVLDRPLEKTIPSGTSIRITNKRQSFLYTDTKDLEPGEVICSHTHIAKFKTYHFFSKDALSDGVEYVRPLILFHSNNNHQIIFNISDCIIIY